jgi:ABC-2 type transport system ATP-binding protein
MIPLSISNLSKEFKQPNGQILRALDGVTLEIQPGSIHGLLGPNGAGKSTLISIVSGILEPTAGSIQVFGIDVQKETERAKQLLGIVPQEMVVEMAFTVKEVLHYFGGMYGVPRKERESRIQEVLEDLSLSDKTNERARGLSGGMKRRLMIAKALLHRPKLLILDEPTAGVDVALRQKIWELVRRLNKEGTTILFTTHYLEEAEQLCDRITLINHGKVVKDGKLKDLQEEFSRNMIHFELFDRNVPHLSGVKEVGSEYEYPVTHLQRDLNTITTHYDGNIRTIKSGSASLETIFLELTK